MPDLDATLRQGTYGDAFWLSRAGLSVDDLWAAYAADPEQPPVTYD